MKSEGFWCRMEYRLGNIWLVRGNKDSCEKLVGNGVGVWGVKFSLRLQNAADHALGITCQKHS